MTQEQINALITKKQRRGPSSKPPQGSGTRTNRQLLPPDWRSKALSTRRNGGPIRSVEIRGYCVSGTWSEEFQERFECKVPTHYKFQGQYYCALHCLALANDMLIEKGVTD